MKGDRVEAVVDTGQGVQTFDIVATKAGRRIEVVTTRGVVEVREVTRSGNPVRTARGLKSSINPRPRASRAVLDAASGPRTTTRPGSRR